MAHNLKQTAFTAAAYCFLTLFVATQAQADDALSGPLSQLQALAKHDAVLSLTQKHDGQLKFDELIEHDKKWDKMPTQRNAFLNTEMQQRFKLMLKENNSVFVGLLLLGSQGETLAAYPLPSDYWHGNTAKFVNVMADENIFVDNLSWDKRSRQIKANLSVPIKDKNGEMFGVLSAQVDTLVTTPLSNNP